MTTPAIVQPTTDSLADQAKTLGLALAVVTPEQVAVAPTDVLPLAVVEARRIFPYRFDEASMVLSIAVADPNQLKVAAPEELQAQRKQGRQLKLELIEPAVFDQLLPAIRLRLGQPNPDPKNSEFRSQNSGPSATGPGSASQSSSALGGSLIPDSRPQCPTVDLSTVSIPRSVFLKIPHDVATKFRLIAFAAPSTTHVKLATDRSADPGVKRVVSVIQSKRGVSVELYQAAGSQIDDLLDAYGGSADPVTLNAPSITKQVPVIPESGIRHQESDMPTAPTDSPTTANPPVAPATPPTRLGAVQLSKPLTPPRPVLPASITSALPASLPPLPTIVRPVPSPSPTPSLPPKPTSPAAPMSVQSNRSDRRPPTAATLPVDTSPVTNPLDPQGVGKIQLASPLPSLSLNSALSLPPMPTSPLGPSTLRSTPTLPALAPSISAPTPLSASVPLSSPPASPTVRPLSPPVYQAPPGPISVPAGGSPPPSLGPLTLDASDDQNLDTLVGSTIRSTEELAAVAKTGLVPKLLGAMLQYAVSTGASDIHLEAETDDLRVRYRIDGQLQDVLKAPLGLHAPLVSRVKILSKMKIDEQRVPQDGRFSASTAGRDVDFRVSTLPAIHGEKVVLRILDKRNGLRSIGELGIDGSNGARITAALAKPFGILLVTGPTGSGKTTTLYSMLTTVNQPGVNIVTLEDPVEYELPGITQTQVKPKIGFGFAEGLRSILRQDPDVIMVGEIRDRETASLATHAALTGHLVLSTLHTNSAAGAIPRFLDMGVEPFLIASSMEAVIGQRLVRKLCEQCRQPAQLTNAVQQDVVAQLNRSSVAAIKARASQPLAFYGPTGCDQCHGGYKGRLGIYEVMTVTPELETLTAKKAPLSEIETLAIQQGMVTMKQDGLMKALAGLTSLDEILRVTTSD